MIYFFAYILCGTVVGFLAGLFGIGGGIIGIPALLALFSLQNIPQSLGMHLAIGTSLAVVIVTTTASIISHVRKQSILYPLFLKFIPGAIFGTILGVIISQNIQSYYLQKIFGIFLLFISLQMFKKIELHPDGGLPSQAKLFLVSFCLGIFSGLLGLGGGVFMIPYFHWCGIPMRNAIATAAVCILPIAIVGSIGYMMSSVHVTSAPALNTGFIYWPAFVGMSIPSTIMAPIGVSVMHKISSEKLKRAFAGLLILIGLTMIFK